MNDIEALTIEYPIYLRIFSYIWTNSYTHHMHAPVEKVKVMEFVASLNSVSLFINILLTKCVKYYQ